MYKKIIIQIDSYINKPIKRKADALPEEKYNLNNIEENYGPVKKLGIKEEFIILNVKDKPKSKKNNFKNQIIS